ncbi:MAG: helix-turn-helix domain-containing protein [Thermoactinomyces sp.]
MSAEIGRRLRSAREASGLTLQDIERRTRISRRDLIAIEQGRFNFHANPVYVRSYIRAYANAVGENPQLILNLLYREQGSHRRGRRPVSDPNSRQFLPTTSANAERTVPPRRPVNRQGHTDHSGWKQWVHEVSSCEPKRRSRSQHQFRSAREYGRSSERESGFTDAEETGMERLSRREKTYSRRNRQRGSKKLTFEKVYTGFLLIGTVLLIIASIWFVWFRMTNA